MSLPTSEPLEPLDPNELPPARRRRMKRRIIPSDSSDQAQFMEEIARRLMPSSDFFMNMILAGVTLMGATWMDSPAIFVLAAILAPFLTPILGLSLATVAGSVSYFFQSMGSFFIGSVLIFLVGLLAGWVMPTDMFTSNIHSQYFTHFSFPNFLLLSISTILAATFLVKAKNAYPRVASVGMAYEIILPAGLAGFGLSSGQPGLWPDGIIVYLVHLSWAVLIATITISFLGLRPRNIFGYTVSSTIALISVAAFIALISVGTAWTTHVALPSPTPSNTPSPTMTYTPSHTPIPPTSTITPTNTLVPSKTPSLTPTLAPTQVWAKVNAGSADGAFVREEPNLRGTLISSLLNGMLVEILPDVVDNQGTTWVHVRTLDGQEGWMVRALLITATPKP
ncbi:MAG: SH3 domain-containing protein [Anaerolineaceae bacterium]|nr:SH3 domain-containing protein [Anaerolineaceae bacterium]